MRKSKSFVNLLQDTTMPDVLLQSAIVQWKLRFGDLELLATMCFAFCTLAYRRGEHCERSKSVAGSNRRLQNELRSAGKRGRLRRARSWTPRPPHQERHLSFFRKRTSRTRFRDDARKLFRMMQDCRMPCLATTDQKNNQNSEFH